MTNALSSDKSGKLCSNFHISLRGPDRGDLKRVKLPPNVATLWVATLLGGKNSDSLNNFSWAGGGGGGE